MKFPLANLEISCKIVLDYMESRWSVKISGFVYEQPETFIEERKRI